MTIHYACRDIFRELIDAILLRAEMDEAVFQTMEATGESFEYIRKAIDPAISKQNVEVQKILRKLLECECPLYKEEMLK